MGDAQRRGAYLGRECGISSASPLERLRISELARGDLGVLAKV
jgi:hypothetical protein